MKAVKGGFSLYFLVSKVCDSSLIVILLKAYVLMYGFHGIVMVLNKDLGFWDVHG